MERHHLATQWDDSSFWESMKSNSPVKSTYTKKERKKKHWGSPTVNSTQRQHLEWRQGHSYKPTSAFKEQPHLSIIVKTSKEKRGEKKNTRVELMKTTRTFKLSTCKTKNIKKVVHIQLCTQNKQNLLTDDDEDASATQKKCTIFVSSRILLHVSHLWLLEDSKIFSNLRLL